MRLVVPHAPPRARTVLDVEALVMRLVVICAVLATVRAPSLAAPAAATVDETVPVSVTARLDGRAVRFTAKWRITAEGPVHARSELTLDLPSGGMAVKASATADGPGEGVAHPLDLAPVATAAAHFEDLANHAAGAARRWSVLLESHRQQQINVSIAAPRKAVITLEMEIQAPACLYRDARHALVPDAWLPVLPSTITRAQDERLDHACNRGRGSWIAFADKALAARPHGVDRVGASAATAALEDGSQVASFELAVADKLGEIPADLATAIIVDASRSMSPKMAEAQRDLVAAYLKAAPDAQVQVIAFARRARALLPGWQVARHAQTRIDRELRALALRNGSNYDAALAEAGAWLARVRGTRRVLLVTDTWRGPRLAAVTTAELQRSVAGTKNDVLVHAVSIDEFSSIPVRDDHGMLVDLAHATGGMSVRTGPLGADEARDVTLLLRPTSLDNVELKAPGWKPLAGMPTCQGSLDEGHACTWWLQGDLPYAIAATGMVWGKRVERVLKPDPARGFDVVRELSRSVALQDDHLADRIDLASRAVGLSWSLSVEWGGRDGYGDVLRMAGMLRGCGTCRHGGPSRRVVGTFGGRPHVPPPAPALDVREQLRGPVERCLAAGDDVAVEVATTLQEIVDVRAKVHSSAAPAREAALRTCVEDAVWDTAVAIPPILQTASATYSFAR